MPRPFESARQVLPICTIFAASLLAGCASTGVIPMNGDSYFIGKKDGAPGLGVSLTNKAEVYSEANTFCRSKGLEVQALKETVKSARPAMLGSTELVFRCVPPGTPMEPLVNIDDQTSVIRSK